MNANKVTSIAFGVIGALMAFIIAMAALQPVQAAPPAAPTPVANLYQSNTGQTLTLQKRTRLTADRNSNSVETLKFNALDISLTIDQHTTVNTTTFTIQYSNDNQNWDDGINLLTSNNVDTTEITKVPVFGRYLRVKQDLTNSQPLTVTILAVGR